MNKDELIKVIVSNKWEYDVILYLISYIHDRNKILDGDCMDYKSRLTMVNKLSNKELSEHSMSIISMLSEVK